MWAYSRESLNNITPQKALDHLKDGNIRFINNLKVNQNLVKQVNQTSRGQFPFAAILSCIDSRTSAELVFDQGLGDIFSIRIAGNVVNSDILGSMEFACSVANSRIIVVLGHTKCGAIISACNNFKLGHITGLINKINTPIAMETTTLKNRNGKNPEFVNNVSILNVHYTIKKIRQKSSILRNLEKSGKILIAGALYNIDSGRVTFL